VNLDGPRLAQSLVVHSAQPVSAIPRWFTASFNPAWNVNEWRPIFTEPAVWQYCASLAQFSQVLQAIAARAVAELTSFD
jgi:hypothetical protein